MDWMWEVRDGDVKDHPQASAGANGVAGEATNNYWITQHWSGSCIPSMKGFNARNGGLTKSQEGLAVVLRSSMFAVQRRNYFRSQEFIESLDLRLMQAITKKGPAGV